MQLTVIHLVRTPAVGLGCDSGAYLLYGAAATAVWFLLTLSAWLSHLWEIRAENGKSTTVCSVIAGAAVITRLLGNTLAVVNGLWVLTFSFLQLTNVYDNCWCNASAFEWGTGAFVTLFSTPTDLFILANRYWSAGTFMGLFCAIISAVFFSLAKGDDLFRTDVS